MNALSKAIDRGKRVFVFLGPTGSGKSEIAVNWALMLAETGKTVRFFDMDQTKPLFRSRGLARLLKKRNVLFDMGRQVLDSPVIPGAVFDSVNNAKEYTVLDVGGDVAGARVLGQFAEAWGRVVAAYMVVNCHRPGLDSREKLISAMEGIKKAARLDCVGVVSNSNFGNQTTPVDVMEGYKHLETLLEGSGYKIEFLTVHRLLLSAILEQMPRIDVVGIERFIKAPWE